jgi:hypothetical protein
MRRFYFLFVVLTFILNSAAGQQFSIKGTIRDAEGLPIPFVSVYIKNTTKGTSANVDGIYNLKADTGRITLVYRAIGFKNTEKKIHLTGPHTEDVVLSSESLTLEGVTITSNGEDPAYAIIRKAIKKRKSYLNESEEFKVNVYIKGMQKLVGAPKRFFGQDIQKTLDLDTNRKGIVYLSESQSIFNFRRPGHIREEMISSKIAGRNNAFSFNKASDMNINFYENILMENTLTTRGFVSPIADNGLFYYRYKLLGFSTENGETVNKIEVTPRRKNDPAFRGIIYIAEDSWRLLGTNVYLTKDAGIEVLDTLSIRQQYSRVQNTYMPATMNFRFSGGVFGFKFQGYFLSVYSNYDLKPNLPKNYFNGEVLKITDTVNRKDSAYWALNRPMQLTQEESTSYRKKDSIETVRTSKPYLDSVQNANNKLTLKKVLLSGYRMSDHENKSYAYYPSLLSSVLYNTVEGFVIKYGVTYTKSFENRRSYSIMPEVRYGFANRLFTASLNGSYFYDPLKRASAGFSIGNGIFDLNNLGTMAPLLNTINNLVFERNFPKFYKRTFITARTNRELASGLQAAVAIGYSKSESLSNHSDFSLFDFKDREFTSNNPFTPGAETPLFPNYKALNFSGSLTYTFDQQYTTRPDGKFYEASKYPTLKLSYRKGIHGAFDSDVDFDFVGLEITQSRINIGLIGYSQFFVGAGKFLNNKTVYFPELQHFRGNNSLTASPDIRRFAFLDFYQFSTNRQYLEAHFEHNFSGLITNKIPMVRKLKLEELIGINYLTQPLKKNYAEYYFGLQRLFLRVTYGFAFDKNKRVEHGFRISYGL